MRIETVQIETENGPVVINESDYDEKVHTLVVAEPKKPARKQAPRKAKVSG